jgi:NAD(P)H-hydrate epimerase
LHAALAGQLVEATWLLLPHEDGFISAAAVEMIQQKHDRVTATLIGPGFGVNDVTQRFMEELLPTDGGWVTGPVVDADGLKLLSRLENWPRRLPDEGVLTPHPGEMSVLTGLSTSEIQGDRMSVAERYSREWGHIVVLKGAFTVIAAPDGRSAVIPVASPALARAGTGDVLAGLIVGLRSQGVQGFEAAAAGSWIHARSGLRAAAVLGSTAAVLAGDVLEGVVDVLANLQASGPGKFRGILD